eukprot:TRINITY_DN30844_c0_g2_i1.p1 TRINITY_DN30844_c0_g2~~TRINITY_DN30844_c0_g2_i1.p1  ORF type:complete len:460 (+),score=91.99 TRINITY_DN30844_c0_g2_i1:80-1381(+)
MAAAASRAEAGRAKARRGDRAEWTSSRRWWERPGSGGVGARHLRTGKLGSGCADSDMLLDALSDVDGDGSSPAAAAGRLAPLRIHVRRARTLATRQVSACEEEVPASAIEEDLTLQDYTPHEHFSTEALDMLQSGALPGTPDAMPSVPRPSTARRLMEARSRQCVVCLCEKEHTLVPLHDEDLDSAQVQDHRFCTDCWAEFLQHGVRQQRPPDGGSGAGSVRVDVDRLRLRCPVCRAGIGIPDVWCVRLDLDQATSASLAFRAFQERPSASARAAGARLTAGASSAARPSAFWAEKRSAQRPPASSCGGATGASAVEEGHSAAASSCVRPTRGAWLEGAPVQSSERAAFAVVDRCSQSPRARANSVPARDGYTTGSCLRRIRLAFEAAGEAASRGMQRPRRGLMAAAVTAAGSGAAAAIARRPQPVLTQTASL